MCKKIVSSRSVKSETEDDRMNVDINTVDFDTLDLIDCYEDVLVSSSNHRMSQGYFAALAGDTEDDLVELLEPSIGIEYSPGKYVAKAGQRKAS